MLCQTSSLSLVSGGAIVLGIVFAVDWGTVRASTVPGMVVVVDMLQLFKKFLRRRQGIEKDKD